MTDSNAVSAAVAKLYDTYPFPPEPFLDEPPPGYNWRWNWISAFNFCAGYKPERQDINILDAGCGSGVSTEYLVHLNPQAQVTGIDLSGGALEVARERCQRSGADRVQFRHLSLFDVDQLPGEFDLINCVGVLHHTADPKGGIQALAQKLAPGGLLHIFVYGELGRWEIKLMQEAIALLQGDRRGDYTDGVQLGRQLFQALPDHSALVRREKERWALENQRDECFADMYVHPQEIDYNIRTVFELIAASGLSFLGFSNPHLWSLDRLVGQAPHLMERAKDLSELDYYRLVEILDPGSISHYEFFLAKPPFEREDWTEDARLLEATAELNPCNSGWPSQSFFNYDYQLIKIDPAQFKFMKACEAAPNAKIEQLIEETQFSLSQVRSLLDQQIIILSRPH
ncbi:class I SAM-dependent methyltransferase [Lyngbya confervoides]|uniref:Class I SAM-dependent methyltransferase n=1 Tax=Lyngbya confervoides BDU141951 TaxID=1574623 RepID=A0ABD4T0B1_9CYAN|nr:class I SAM-dependent methyltransferase [Lyngbya confervoides]MCM1981968.1 class I SAM-dependent methyltransferase [Lyngbya confervoides BDU141951]